MHVLCGSMKDACFETSPDQQCPRNLWIKIIKKEFGNLSFADYYFKLVSNILCCHSKCMVLTNCYGLVSYSGCVFIESQGIG